MKRKTVDGFDKLRQAQGGTQEMLARLTSLDHQSLGAALGYFMRVRNANSVGPLLRVALSRRTRVQRCAAIMALSRQRAVAAIEPLMDLADDLSQPEIVRETALRTVGGIIAATVLVRLQKQSLSKDWKISLAASTALVNMKTGVSAPQLSGLMNNAEVPDDIRDEIQRLFKVCAGNSFTHLLKAIRTIGSRGRGEAK